MLLNVSLYLVFIVFFFYAIAFSEERRHAKEIIRYAHLNMKIDKTVTEEDLKHQPPLLKAVLERAGVLGRPVINQVSVHSKGRSRRLSRIRWSRFQCTDYYFFNIGAFVEEITLGIWPLIRIKIINRFKGGTMEKLVLVLSAIPTERINGKFEENHNALIRYIRHMVLAPTTLLAPEITWTQVGLSVLIGEFNMRGYKVKIYLSIDDQCRITNLVSRKYYFTKGRYRETLWSCTFDDFQKVKGYLVPMALKTQWHLDDGAEGELDVKLTKVDFQ